MHNPEAPEGNEQELSPEIANSILFAKLSDRIRDGHPADVVCLDVDGTVYLKIQTEDGKWKKEGDNSALSEKLARSNIPLVLISGRPDWDEKSDQEMADLSLMAPDVVVVGAGSVIYWRQQDGSMKPDEEFSRLMREQKVTYEIGEAQAEFAYDAERIVQILNSELAEFQSSGFERAKVDQSKGINFVTLDITDMSLANLGQIVARVKETLQGVKVMFSENLEKVDGEKFSGWVQIIPLLGGKDGATRYLFDRISQAINPASIDAKKPQGHIVGDASVDIWMLSLGTGKNQPYKLNEYALANATPYEEKPAAPADLVGSLSAEELSMEELYTRQALERSIKQPRTSRVEESIRSGVRDLGHISTIEEPGRVRSNLNFTKNGGPEGVFEVVETL